MSKNKFDLTPKYKIKFSGFFYGFIDNSKASTYSWTLTSETLTFLLAISCQFGLARRVYGAQYGVKTVLYLKMRSN